MDAGRSLPTSFSTIIWDSGIIQATHEIHMLDLETAFKSNQAPTLLLKKCDDHFHEWQIKMIELSIQRKAVMVNSGT